MSKGKKRHATSKAPAAKNSRSPLIGIVLAVAALAGAAIWFSTKGNDNKVSGSSAAATSNAPALARSTTLATNVFERPTASGDTNLPVMEVAQAVMVTWPLDFAGKPPSVAEAQAQVERVYQPDSGTGRTFAVLEAFGVTNSDSKVQISFRVSSEAPGLGALVFKRTGEVLWKARVVPRAGNPPAEKQLTIMVDDDAGQSYLIDGSKGPTRILDAPVNQRTERVRDLWPDGAERTMTFIYSTCGCPIKARVKRVGETTVRTSDWPVLFPDDPAAMSVISSLMGWAGTPP
jgi:hypothetical protein